MGPELDSRVTAAAKAGDQAAVTELVGVFKPWIYNIALRMVWSPADAEDVTQDVLLKVLKGLPSFEGRSRLSTWVYRVAVNHLLNRRANPIEARVTSFDDYGRGLDSAGEHDLPEFPGLERELLVEEAKVGCMTGMLLCLSREQRLAYVLGSVFALEDTVCAELLDISREAFRKRLSRARADLHAFMQGKCGLVDETNPCRCARKTKFFIEKGFVDPSRLRFVVDHAKRVHEVANQQAANVFTAVTEDYPKLYRDHPFADPPTILEGLRRVLAGTSLDGVL